LKDKWAVRATLQQQQQQAMQRRRAAQGDGRRHVAGVSPRKKPSRGNAEATAFYKIFQIFHHIESVMNLYKVLNIDENKN
jgi:hypothetical protein